MRTANSLAISTIIGAMVLVLYAISVVACAHNPAQLRPGAYNVFDQNAHDILRTTQATLEAAAKEVSPLPAGHPLKVAYNAAIDAYNAAERGYQTYHAALASGGAGDQAGVQALLQGLNSAITAYATAKAKPLGPTAPAANLWIPSSSGLLQAAA